MRHQLGEIRPQNFSITLDFYRIFNKPINAFDLRVPVNYSHSSYIDARSREIELLSTTKHRSEKLTSTNFARATDRLYPDLTYRVEIFMSSERVTLNHALLMMEEFGYMLVGAHGLLLVQQYHPEVFLPKKSYTSLDKSDALYVDERGPYGVPRVDKTKKGNWNFTVHEEPYEDVVLYPGSFLLCIREQSLEQLLKYIELLEIKNKELLSRQQKLKNAPGAYVPIMGRTTLNPALRGVITPSDNPRPLGFAALAPSIGSSDTSPNPDARHAQLKAVQERLRLQMEENERLLNSLGLRS